MQITAVFNSPMQPDYRIFPALLISLLLHTAIIAGVSLSPPEQKTTKVAKSMDVILVNSKSQTRPVDAKVLAQANLDGGGNVAEDRRAKTPLPVLPGVKPVTSLSEVTRKTRQLEKEVKKLLTAAESKAKVVQPLPHTKPGQDKPVQNQPAALNPDNHDNLLQRSLEIARLEAQIAKDHEAYQKRPKRKFIGARTRDYRFARYLEDWRLKVERIGNLNYPDVARKQKLYGSLQLTVGIRSDGSLESIGIDRSSGVQVLDDAAIHIVRLAARNGFSPFPPDIRRDTDILHITRTWVFSRADKLLSE
ncbi:MULTISPECIES: energy transducer TonB [Nitrosomonas]|uniref:Putative TonB protein n=1 Tax=Nitrosomonas europaea (strain ATCC 19718 / CIP 103999 / KCTC 2705 / NBRC 14298) TaxID=228410 RepID=Q82U75_NITEU|nr:MULTISPECIES: TonB family protein [Nitrosomonas]CAD85537.1 putative TonB protein [Nitrosomonas europaea ATCC 19718]SDW45451.1 protein TonB [Nitrosomonas europaea]SET06922.1 protein TonB [Nitrosomonas europaea]SJZ58292.1 protein TonB [Nitrosomonas europaea]